MSTFSPFVQALAKYRPYIKKEIPYILTFVYIFAIFVCMCVIFSMSLPPEYIVYAICSIILTVATALLTLCAHAHPIEELSYCVFVCALFALTSSSALIRTIYGEHTTCSKLYDNDAASSALSDRLDELGSASGSVVSASLLNAEASQQISHYGMLCMGLRYSDAWYRVHIVVLYVLASMTIINSITSFAITLLNFKGVVAWLEAREHALMHIFQSAEAGIKARVEKLGSYIHHHHRSTQHHHSE